jgi:hypothetical protein
MASAKVNFYNSGDAEYNDIVYQDRTFDVTQASYKFELIGSDLVLHGPLDIENC